MVLPPCPIQFIVIDFPPEERLLLKGELIIQSALIAQCNKFLLDGDFGKWCLHVYLIRTDLTLDMLTFQPDEVIDAQFVLPPALNDHPLVAGILRRDPSILPTLLSGK